MKLTIAKSYLLCVGLLASSASHASCPSEATLNIQSSNYSGRIDIELRKGNRPGSHVIARNSVNSQGSVVFRNVCPGTYFYSFSTPDSDDVSTTRYFQIINDGYQYSMPEVTVTYSRSSGKDTNRIGKAKRNEL